MTNVNLLAVQGRPLKVFVLTKFLPWLHRLSDVDLEKHVGFLSVLLVDMKLSPLYW